MAIMSSVRPRANAEYAVASKSTGGTLTNLGNVWGAPKSTGSVLGLKTGGGTPTPVQTQAPAQEMFTQNVEDENARVRADIEGGYNSYFQMLDSELNSSIPTQRAAMESQAQSQGRQMENTLSGQLTEGKSNLNAERTKVQGEKQKSLANLADDIQNLIQAGQINLGARGAGDSSAANMWSYAITKMGNKSRGAVENQVADINSQINDKEFKLQNTYNTEINNIKEQVNQKMSEVATWFAQAQQRIQEMKAQGQLAKGQDLANLSRQALSMAQNQLLAAQQEASNRRSMLDQWAMNNSQTIQGLKANLAQVGSYTSPGLTSPGLAVNTMGDQSGNMSITPTGYTSEWWRQNRA